MNIQPLRCAAADSDVPMHDALPRAPAEVLSDGDVCLHIAPPSYPGDHFDAVASMRVLRNASRMWDTMFRVPLTESRTREVTHGLDVPANTWRRLLRDLHEIETLHPHLDEVVGLHTLVDFLLPREDTRTGRALTQIAATSLELLWAAPHDRLAPAFAEAVQLCNDEAIGVLSKRLYARPLLQQPMLLELDFKPFVELLERLGNRPGMQRLELVANYAHRQGDGQGTTQAWADALGARALFDTSLVSERWSGLGLAQPVRSPRAGGAFVPDKWRPLRRRHTLRRDAETVHSLHIANGAVLAGNDHRLSLFDLRSGMQLRTHYFPGGGAGSVAADADRIVASTYNFTDVYAWNTLAPVGRSARQQGEFSVVNPVLGAGWFAVTNPHDDIVLISDHTGERRRFSNGSMKPYCLAAAGSTIVAANRQGVGVVWDAGSGEVTGRFDVPVSLVRGLAVTPHHIVLAGDRTLEVAEADTRIKRHTLLGGGRWMTADGIESFVEDTPLEITALAVQDDLIAAATLNPSGPRVDDKHDAAIHVWNAVTGECLQTIEAHEDRISALAIGEGCIVSASWDKTIRIWAADKRRLSDAPLLGLTTLGL